MAPRLVLGAQTAPGERGAAKDDRAVHLRPAMLGARAAVHAKHTPLIRGGLTQQIIILACLANVAAKGFPVHQRHSPLGGRQGHVGGVGGGLLPEPLPYARLPLTVVVAAAFSWTAMAAPALPIIALR